MFSIQIPTVCAYLMGYLFHMPHCVFFQGQFMASLWELSSYFAGEFANNESNQASTETDILGVTTHLVSDHSLMLTL